MFVLRGPSGAKIPSKGCLRVATGVREQKRRRETDKKGDKVSGGDGGGDSSMVSGRGEMCVTQSQIGNRCFNLASLGGYPLR